MSGMDTSTDETKSKDSKEKLIQTSGSNFLHVPVCRFPFLAFMHVCDQFYEKVVCLGKKINALIVSNQNDQITTA